MILLGGALLSLSDTLEGEIVIPPTLYEANLYYGRCLDASLGKIAGGGTSSLLAAARLECRETIADLEIIVENRIKLGTLRGPARTQIKEIMTKVENAALKRLAIHQSAESR